MTKTVTLYDSMGLITVLHNHLHVLGESPLGPTALLHCITAALAFCKTLSIRVL